MIAFTQDIENIKKGVQDCLEALKNEIDSLGRVVEEMGVELGKIRQESQTRTESLSNEMTEMESRIMIRLEELETSKAEEAETDILEEDNPSRGHLRWTERKRAAANAAMDLSKWKPQLKPAAEKKD